MRKHISIYPVLIWLVISPVVLADYPIEVIELKSRPLEDVLPLIKPLLGTGETATGMGNNLVIKASPAQVRDIRRLLLEIDRPPRRVLITVSTQGERSRASSGYSADADIRVGDGQVSINSPGHAVSESRARVRIHDESGQRTRNTGQTVQGLEGRPAYIASGLTVPVQDVERYSRYGQLHERTVTRMYDASSGFYVVPRLNGEYVTLEIHQRDDQPGMRRGVIDTQRSNTVVRGRLGEWISLGGVNTHTQGSQGGLGQSQTMQGSVDQQINVRVDCLDCAGSAGQLQQVVPRLQGVD